MGFGVCPHSLWVGAARQAGSSPQSAVLTGGRGRVTCVSRRGRREQVLRPGLPAAARLVQALSPLRPRKPRPGRRRPRDWAGRGASPARTLRLRSLRLPRSLTRRCPRGRRLGAPGIRAGTEGLPLPARWAGPGAGRLPSRAARAYVLRNTPLERPDLKQSPASPSDLVFCKGAGRQPQSISTLLFVFKAASRFLDI